MSLFVHNLLGETVTGNNPRQRHIKARYDRRTEDDTVQQMMQNKYQKCIDTCYDCAKACDMCASACLDEKNVKTLTRCIKLDMDCADSCVTAARYMSRNSELSDAMCFMCAEICDACAEECETHSSMEHCKKCAEACRTCAEECRRMTR